VLQKSLTISFDFTHCQLPIPPSAGCFETLILNACSMPISSISEELLPLSGVHVIRIFLGCFAPLFLQVAFF